MQLTAETAPQAAPPAPAGDATAAASAAALQSEQLARERGQAVDMAVDAAQRS